MKGFLRLTALLLFIGTPLIGARADSPFSESECATITKVATNLVKRLGVNSFSIEFRQSLRNWLAANLTCDGPRDIAIRQYREIAYVNLLTYELSVVPKPPIDLARAKWTLVEAGASDRIAQILPTGTGPLDDTLVLNVVLDKKQFEESSLSTWFLSFEAYQALRLKGFQNQDILRAVEDTWITGSLSQATLSELTDRAILSRDDHARRDERNCLYRRSVVALGVDQESQRLKALYQAANSESDKKKWAAAIMSRGRQVQDAIRCEKPK